MSLYYFILIYFLLGFVFTFTFWRKLKDDYVGRQIFSISFPVIAILFLSFYLSNKYSYTFTFWITYILVLFVAIIASKIQRIKLYELYEALAPSLIPIFSTYLFLDAAINNSLFSLGYGVLSFLFIFLYIYLNSKYKNFGWYKSGKIGFASLTSIGIFFLVRGVIAIIFPFVLSFAGIYEPIMSGVAAFAHFLLVFDLSKRI